MRCAFLEWCHLIVSSFIPVLDLLSENMLCGETMASDTHLHVNIHVLSTDQGGDFEHSCLDQHSTVMVLGRNQCLYQLSVPRLCFPCSFISLITSTCASINSSSTDTSIYTCHIITVDVFFAIIHAIATTGTNIAVVITFVTVTVIRRVCLRS